MFHTKTIHWYLRGWCCCFLLQWHWY